MYTATHHNESDKTAPLLDSRAQVTHTCFHRERHWVIEELARGATSSEQGLVLSSSDSLRPWAAL